jgi:hypothetical protein
MPNSYWIASGQFLKAIGKLLGNAQIKLGVMKHPVSDKTEFPSGY